MRYGQHWTGYPPDDPPTQPNDEDRCPVCGHVDCTCPPEEEISVVEGPTP